MYVYVYLCVHVNAPSFGFGDRIGLATPGHVESMNRAGDGIEAIYPQQSIREMTRTQRTAQEVMDDALADAFDDSDAEEEADEVVNQVLDEIGVDLAGMMAAAPTSKISTATANTDDAALDREADQLLAQLQAM